MRVDYNRSVFESLPDSVYSGEMPALPKRSRSRYAVLAAVATAFSLCLAAASTILALMVHEQSSLPEAIAESEIVYTVNNSLQGNIVLPDSTLVTLNSGSSLKLASDFGKETRTVYLDGEGYFDVYKNPDCPFQIRTPQDVLVTVTGTKFNLKCFADSKFDLTLIQGSVEVRKPNEEVIIMMPSEEIVVSNDFHNVATVDKPDEALSWTQGILKFDRTPMSEAIGQIERWYGVDIEVTDNTVYNSSFTAEFKSETLKEVLELLCLTSRLSYTMDETTITLNPIK